MTFYDFWHKTKNLSPQIISQREASCRYLTVVQLIFMTKSPRTARMKMPNRQDTAVTHAPLTSSFRMTLFSLARSVTNRRADGGPQNLPFSQNSLSNNNLLRMMADVCEAFRFFCVFSGLIMNIRVHSCPFVVLNN